MSINNFNAKQKMNVVNFKYFNFEFYYKYINRTYFYLVQN